MKRKVIISLIAILILMLSQYKLLLTGYANFFTLKDLSSCDKQLELLEEKEFAIAHPEVGADFMGDGGPCP